jgi:flagellar biosynthesis protein FliP
MEPIVLVILLVIVFSAFVKIATTLTVFRYGVGLQGFEFGAVSLIIALVLAWATMPIPLSSLDPRILSGERVSLSETETLLNTIRPQLEKSIDEKILRAVSKSLAKEGRGEEKNGTVQSSLEVTIPAFVISEVKRALILGVTLLVPFVLLDLLVAHFLTLLGIQQLAVATVAFPLKLIVFLSVSGWELLIGKLLS